MVNCETPTVIGSLEKGYSPSVIQLDGLNFHNGKKSVAKWCPSLGKRKKIWSRSPPRVRVKNTSLKAKFLDVYLVG